MLPPGSDQASGLSLIDKAKTVGPAFIIHGFCQCLTQSRDVAVELRVNHQDAAAITQRVVELLLS